MQSWINFHNYLFSNTKNSRDFPASPIADLGVLGVPWRRGLAVRQAHNVKVVSSNLAPTTNKPLKSPVDFEGFLFGACSKHWLGHSWGTAEREFAGRFGGVILLWKLVHVTRGAVTGWNIKRSEWFFWKNYSPSS